MSEKTAGQLAGSSRKGVRYLARHQVMGLSAQFLFGMAVSLVGQPSETTGTARTASTILLGLHVLVAVGLVAGAVMVLRAARGASRRQRQAAHWGAVMIALTFVTGVLTMITNSNAWSYGMGIGFIASLGIYVALLIQAGSPAREPESPAARDAA